MLFWGLIVPKGGLRDGNNNKNLLVNNGFWMNWNKRKMLLNFAAAAAAFSAFISLSILLFIPRAFEIQIVSNSSLLSSYPFPLLPTKLIGWDFFFFYSNVIYCPEPFFLLLPFNWLNFCISLSLFFSMSFKTLSRVVVVYRLEWIPSSNFHHRIKIYSKYPCLIDV